METVFRVNLAELNVGFLEIIKSLFGQEREVEIAVSAAKRSLKKEDSKAYFLRLKKAKESAEKGNLISFTPKELEEFAKKLKGI